MDYPREFSAQARDRIEAEKILACRELGSSPQSREFKGCILRIFLVFAKEACALGQSAGWPVHKIRLVAEEGLRQLTIEIAPSDWVDNWSCAITKPVRKDLEGWRRKGGTLPWREYEDLLLAVASRKTQLTPVASSPSAKKSKCRRDPDISKRRQIVQNNRTVQAVGLCQLFDHHNIPLTRTTVEAGSWEKAYMSETGRRSIDSLISRDRKTKI
jgi:hypothetical protein